MILNPHLAVAPEQISVRYRATAEPQDVEMEVTTKAPRPLSCMHAFFSSWLGGMSQGGGGSDVFSPLDGKARRLSAPPPDASATFVWRFSLQSVAPIALRDVLATLNAMPEGYGFIERFRLTGSAPLDDGPLSVTERQLLGWFDDVDAYPKRWPAVPEPFAVVAKAIAKGARIKVTFAEAPSPEIEGYLKGQIDLWKMLVMQYPDLTRSAGGHSRGPKYAREGSQITATFSQFTYARGPAEDALVNMMIWFHHRVSAIRKLELALP